jgi:hypothetical protein
MTWQENRDHFPSTRVLVEAHSGEHTVRPYAFYVGANRVFALPHNFFYKSIWNHSLSPEMRAA